MSENDRNSDDLEVTYFHYCRDHLGNLTPVAKVRRNNRIVPRFEPSITEPQTFFEPEEMPDYQELVRELTQNLNPMERRTWELIIQDGKSVFQVAEEEGISRQAVYHRLRRMIQKNDYCAISAVHGVLKRKLNQYT